MGAPGPVQSIDLSVEFFPLPLKILIEFLSINDGSVNALTRVSKAPGPLPTALDSLFFWNAPAVLAFMKAQALLPYLPVSSVSGSVSESKPEPDCDPDPNPDTIGGGHTP